MILPGLVGALHQEKKYANNRRYVSLLRDVMVRKSIASEGNDLQ